MKKTARVAPPDDAPESEVSATTLTRAAQEDAVDNDDPASDDAAHESTKERSRKRRRDDDNLEAAYMQRLAMEEAKEDAKRREAKRQKVVHSAKSKVEGVEHKKEKKAKKDKTPKQAIEEDGGQVEAPEDEADDDDEEMLEPSDAGEDQDETNGDIELIGSDDEPYEIPKHESLNKSTPSSTTPGSNPDLEKSLRTVFLSNVSTSAITSKSSKATLLSHLTSIFPLLPTPPPKDTPQTYTIESLRFRSTAFSTPLPKKAAFARKDLMSATTAATNAYAVYSHTAAARVAAQKLNGSVVLSRHLRVDSVAHPSPIDHRRCVFVGNLGFVDDETAVKAASAAEDAARRGEDAKTPRPPRAKPAADTEEGLWQVFGKAGVVESVRVVRDPKTRVGKGFAYVQFEDQNAVEKALLYNEKKFPPMLPRKLRVVRAKRPVKRDAVPAGGRGVRGGEKGGQENPNHTQLGRARKLLGRAGGAASERDSRQARAPRVGDVSISRGPPGLGKGVRPPEAFVFEGHRASSKQGGGSKKGGAGKKKGEKPKNRSAKRGAAWKAGAKKGSK